jgi:hypothetical protein
MNLTHLLNNGKRKKRQEEWAETGELKHQANLPLDILTIKIGTFPLKGET